MSCAINFLFGKCLFARVMLDLLKSEWLVALSFSENWFLLFVGCPFQIAWEAKRRCLFFGAVCVIIFVEPASIYWWYCTNKWHFKFFSWSSKRFTYDDVVEKVAHQLGLDEPSKIRLTQHNPYSHQPKPHHIKYRGVNYLSDMLQHHTQVWSPFFGVFYYIYISYIIWLSSFFWFSRCVTYYIMRHWTFHCLNWKVWKHLESLFKMLQTMRSVSTFYAATYIFPTIF